MLDLENEHFRKEPGRFNGTAESMIRGTITVPVSRRDSPITNQGGSIP